jgi:repressor LexA
MSAPTRRQKEVLEFMTRYIDSHGYRPSYQLIARHMGLRSRAGIGRIVRDLEHRGLLQRRRESGHFYIDVHRTANGGASKDTVEISWLFPTHQDPMQLPKLLLSGFDPAIIRLCRVNAYPSEHILEDDIAMIEVRDFARDGQLTIVQHHRSEPMLRRIFRRGPSMELHADDETEPTVVTADRVKILGVYRGLLRCIG